MGCKIYDGVTVCGNFTKLSKRKPKNWFDVGYRIMVPFDFKWRAKLGKVECDCMEVEETYQPWYGTSWFHSKQCALMQYYEKYPQRFNFVGGSPDLIAQTD